MYEEFVGEADEFDWRGEEGGEGGDRAFADVVEVPFGGKTEDGDPLGFRQLDGFFPR